MSKGLSLVLLGLVAAVLGGRFGLSRRRPRRRPTRASLPPASGPLWVDYGDGSVPAEVRAVFGRPGVVAAATGTRFPTQYRALGAKTVFFTLKLPSLVGDPGKPADPTTIEALADRTYDRAVLSTLCDRPWIGLNELAGPANPVPWADNVRAYRQNILELMQRLHERGATPVLLVHGSPVYTGEAKAWWKAVGATGHVVYESYYKAPGDHAARADRRPAAASPRDALGDDLVREHRHSRATTSGVMLGFQVAPGKAGREGLQPSQDWYRYVKWNALAARQVAQDMGLGSIWSWGWGNLSAAAKDPDKPAAACVYLWARDQSLCDGKAAAGPDFKASLVEGPIVMGDLSQCISVAGKLPRTTVRETNAAIGNLDVAVSATFVRQVLRRKLTVSAAEIDTAENEVIARAFGGSRDAYLAALSAAKRDRRCGPRDPRGRDSPQQAQRSVRDDHAHAGSPTRSPLRSTPRPAAETDSRESATSRSPTAGVGGRAARPQLPFLLDDTEPPLAPTGGTMVATGTTVTIDWADNLDADLLGYYVYRRTARGRTAHAAHQAALAAVDLERSQAHRGRDLFDPRC